ncbi:MAG: hypothetical protein OK439_02905 [Thaumarchaeota archaeon]|nr:hypothetical protein [Nitrososphaerota archaeon]
MANETPLVSKAFKLVSFAIIIAIVAIASSAAYSGYQEYNALTTIVGSNSQNQLSAQINGSTLVISGLQVPNKMTYPLSLELLGSVSLADSQIGEFDSGSYLIKPGLSQSINISVGLNFSKIITNSRAFQSVLFNSSILSINSTVAARMIPLLGINISKSANSTLGPVMSSLAVSLGTSQANLSSDGQFLLLPMTISWGNLSPLTAQLWLNATLTGIPNKPTGNYGFGSGPVNLVVGQNSETYLIKIPASEFSGGSFPHGNYNLQITLSQTRSSSQLAQILESVNK